MIKLPYRENFDRNDSLADWSYFGHHQFYELSDDYTLHLGIIPEYPINDYRSGEKVILNRLLPTDYSVSVNIEFGEDTEQDYFQAGILLRCSRVSVGYDSHQGYYAGLIPEKQVVIFGKMDGTKYVELDRASVEHPYLDVPQRLQVDVSGDEFAVSHEGRTVLRSRMTATVMDSLVYALSTAIPLSMTLASGHKVGDRKRYPLLHD